MNLWAWPRAATGAFVLTLALALLLQLLPLPAALSIMRPLWIVLVLAYWSLFGPNVSVLTAALLMGLGIDTLYDCPLGQNVIGYLLVAYLLTRMRLTLGLYPTWQLAVALLPLWFLYALTMWVMDGMAHHPSDALPRFLPVLSTAVVWPVVVIALDALRGKSSRE